MNSERAISSARRQGCLQSRKAAPCSTARRRSRNEKGKVAPFQRQRERKQEGKGDERGRMWRGMMERGPWRKMRVAERRGWRDADGSVLLPPLHPLAALSRFPTPAGFHPCEPPSTFRLALPGVEKPRNITHSRWASLFSLLLPFSPPPPPPPRLRCSCVAHYVRHTSSHRRRCRGEQGALGPDYLFIVDFLRITSNFVILWIVIWNVSMKARERTYSFKIICQGNICRCPCSLHVRNVKLNKTSVDKTLIHYCITVKV